MANFLFIIQKGKEANILKMAFEQFDIKVLVSELNFANYIQTLQIKPDIVFLEIPGDCEAQFQFITMMKGNKTGQKIPILGYGNKMNPTLIKEIFEKGLSAFLTRPLKFTEITKSIQNLCDLGSDVFTKSDKKNASDRESEFKFLLNKSNPPMEKIELMVGYVDKLLAFPFTIAKVISVTSDDNSSAASLAKAIEADPVISATILKVSNTVLFASRDKKITSVKDAIIRVGFKETRNIALSLSVMKIFDNQKNNLGFDRKKFWYHSLATGLIAERLAKNCGYKFTGEAFLSGLLHDFGVILLDEFFSEIFQTIMENTTVSGKCFVEEVENTLVISHNDVAEQLFENWHLPSSICYAVKNHNKFQGDLPTGIHQDQLLAEIVGVSNIIAKTYMLGQECDRFVSRISDEQFKKIKSINGVTTGFMQFIYSQLNIYNKFLNLDSGIQFPVLESEIDSPDEIQILIMNNVGGVFSSFEQYLNTQGYDVNHQTGYDLSNISTNRPDVCVLEIGLSDGVEDIQPIIEGINNSKNTQKMPLIVIYPPESSIIDAELGENVYRLPDSMDLRRLDAIIMEVRQNQTKGENDTGLNDDVDLMANMKEIDLKKITSDVDKLTIDK